MSCSDTLQLPLLKQSLTDPETRFATRQPEWSSSPPPPPHSSRIRATCTGHTWLFTRMLDLNSSPCAVEMQVLLPTEPFLQIPKRFFSTVLFVILS